MLTENLKTSLLSKYGDYDYTVSPWITSQYIVNNYESMKLSEKDNTYIMKIEMPGVDRSSIDITVEDTGVKVSFKPIAKDIEAELLYGSLASEKQTSRQYGLPAGTRVGKSSATYEDGILTIKMEKMVNKIKVDKIKVD